MSSTLTGSAARSLEKAIKQLGKTANKASANAVQIAVKQAGAFYMSFDDTESLPYVKDSDGMITVSGKGLASSTHSVDEVLSRQTQIAASTMETQLQRGLKEFLT